MKRKLNILIKYICKYTHLNHTNAIKYLIDLFSDACIFELSEKKQTIIIDNLLLFFDSVVIRNKENYNVNKNYNSKNILHYITSKTHNLSNNIENIKLY